MFFRALLIENVDAIYGGRKGSLSAYGTRRNQRDLKGTTKLIKALKKSITMEKL